MSAVMAFAEFLDSRCMSYQKSHTYRLKLERERPRRSPRATATRRG